MGHVDDGQADRVIRLGAEEIQRVGLKGRRPGHHAPCSRYRLKSMETEVWSIGDLVRAMGTKVETIRFYEKSGLLSAPPRTAGHYRAYGAEHLGRLSFIRRARDLGFSMEQIATALAFADRKDQSCEAVDIVAHAHLAKIDRKLRPRHDRRLPDY